MSKKSLTDASRVAITNVKLDEDSFRKLPIDDKRTYLDALDPRERMALILGDPDDKKLARVMQPHEL